ncbi:MAG: pyruvate formate lyase activating enzyme [Thermoproteota archaeon]|nr:pyruvate formate lyase activating enzyme [Thermoproteota archaeon]
MADREAMFYERNEDGSLKCNLCGRRCLILEGKSGVCGARINEKGKLWSRSYSRSCSASVDPIEKKPLFHFNPGAVVYSVASPFCNFFCAFCDNWIISQQRSLSETLTILPEDNVKSAKTRGCQGISYTYTEPTVFFEWAFDSAKIAHSNSLFNTFVTNGYLTPEAVKTIAPYLDAATVDFKGAGNPEFYNNLMRVPSVEPIYDCLKEMKKQGIHIEVTNLIVPKYGNSEEDLKRLATWLKDNLGEDTPFHLLRFFPNFDLIDIPQTSIQSMERAAKIAKETGLKYVYAGNVPGNRGENTYCPKCNELLVERYNFSITRWNVAQDNTCPRCGEKIAIKGRFHKNHFS